MLSQGSSAFTAPGPGPTLPSGAFALVRLDEAAASSQGLIVYRVQSVSVFYNPKGSASGFAITPDGGGKFLQLLASSTDSIVPGLTGGSVQII